jgi:hypothetical protein
LSHAEGDLSPGGDAEGHAASAEIISRSKTETFPIALRGDGVIAVIIVAFEYAIVGSLLLVSAVVVVRTIVDFARNLGGFPQIIIPAVDGILVVIILLDIVHTVFRHLREAAFPVRPFLVIGILAGVRDILSASAKLTLSTNISSRDFTQTLITLGVGVGLVLGLLLGLFILSHTGHDK